MVTALMSHGADLCHGWEVFDLTVTAAFFSSLGMIKIALLQK
jgi:hypothetical protein